MNYTDLHVHSTASDGTFPPARLAAYAAEKGLASFALTDHDTLKGIPQAVAAAAPLGIEVIPGIEFSTMYQEHDVHILGLDIDCSELRFQAEVRRLQEDRKQRNQKIIDRMAKDGIDISLEQMKALFGDTLWTRAHFARYLAEKGYVKEMWDAFSTYIGIGCPYYIPREKVCPLHIVQLIRENGGIPILAHPFQYHFTRTQLETLIHQLKEAGLLGIEAIYSTHSQEQEREARMLARNFGLGISGGSDFHGAHKPDIDLGSGRGNLKIPCEILEQLRSRAAMQTCHNHEVTARKQD